MFKKRNRNFRRRNVSEEDERTDEANTNTVPVESANEVAGEPTERKEKVEIKQTFVVTVANEDIVKSGPGKGQGVGVGVVGGGGGGCGGKGDVEDGGENQEKKKGPRSAASLLSFCDEEDEGEVIHVKKPTLSRKLAKKLKQEYLQESQRYTQDKGPNKEGNAEDCVEGSAVSQHGVQPSLGPTILGKEVEMEVDNDSGEDGKEISQKMRSEAPLRPFSFLSSLKPGEIPDARFIHEARKRRQLAREQGGVAYGPAPSFIPLESGGSTARRTGNNPALQSRLVRDSDGDDDEDEDEGASRGKDLTGDGGESGCDGVCGGRRIAMRGLRTRTQRQAIAEEIGIEDSDDERLDLEHGQDDDVRTWEQGQLQKAIGLVSVQQAAAPHDGGPFHEVYRGTLPQPFAPIGPVYPQAVMLPSQHQTLSAEPPSLGQLTKSLQNKLVALQEQRARHRIELEGVRTDLESCRKMINQLGASSLEAASRYSFHQELVGYIRDLSECLNEKVPTVNELDSALLDVLAGRAARLARRRREDVTDEASQCTPPLSRQGKTDGMSRNQNMDAAMQRRVAEREARRTRRRQAREGVEITNSPYATHHEGLSSDDEETSIDVATFTAEKERILEEATSIWIDVWEEFGTVSGISIRFASWHKSFPAAYQQAFAALCLSRLLTPLLQIQLLRWNPLEHIHTHFATHNSTIQSKIKGTLSLSTGNIQRLMEQQGPHMSGVTRGWCPRAGSSTNERGLTTAMLQCEGSTVINKLRHASAQGFTSLSSPELGVVYIQGATGAKRSPQGTIWVKPNCPDLESFPWFESLLFYGCDDIGSSITKEEKVDGIAAGNGPPTDDPDLEIIPSLVEKVVIPRLNNLVRTVWDPMSTSQTERLVRTVTLIIKNYPTATLAVSKPSKALLKSILLRLRQAVDEDVFIPIYHKIVMEKGSAQARFALRKFWSAVKLMRSVAAWHGLLNATSLRELSLDGILNRYLLLSLQAAPPSSGLMQAQQIVSILPRAWCEWDAEGGQSPPQLANLCRYIYHAATSIHRLAFGCPDTERRQARETVQQACQLLRSMGATDHATALTAECNPTPSTQSQAANTPSPATSILNPAAGPQHM